MSSRPLRCLTLSQFAANSSSYLGNETDISLFLLPGNHSLDNELSLAHADNVSMTKDSQDNETVFVECASQSGRFSVRETTFVSIKSLHFIGCGALGNTFTHVDQFILEGTIFQGVEGRGTALMLNGVAAASIVGSKFLSNSFSYAGGVMITFGSAFSITSSTFTNNSAAYGGVMATHESSFNITNSTFTNNSAAYGGVMATHESSFNI